MPRFLKSLTLLFILMSSVVLAQDKPSAPPKPTPEIQKLIDEGRNSVQKYEWTTALQTFEKARDLAQKAKDGAGEASALANIGIVYSSTGHPQKALEFYHHALISHKQTGDKSGEAYVLTGIGKVYHAMSQPQKTLEFYQQALLLYKEAGNKNGAAIALTGIGFAYDRIGQPQKALEFYQQALPLHKETGNKTVEATTLSNIGLVYYHLGQPQKALEFYQQALPLHRQIGNKAVEAGTLTGIGNAYKKIGQSQKALELYQQALPLLKQVGDKTGEAIALNNIGMVSTDLGNYYQAEKFLQDSLPLWEQLRGAMGGSTENRQMYLAAFLPTYTFLIFVQTQLKEDDRAFATLNKMKGRTLLDQSARTRRLFTSLPIAERATLRKLWREVDQQSLLIVAAEKRGGKAREEAQSKLASAERALQIEQDTLFARHPKALAGKEVQTIALSDVPKFLPADTALLEYVAVKFETDNKQTDEHLLFVVTVEQDKPVVTVHKLAVKQARLAALSEQFRQSCAKPHRSYKPLAQRLARLLLPADVQKRLVGKKRVVICPDGAVWNVPFAALVLPDGKHLIETYEIDYAYSATGAQSALAVPKGNATGTLVLANPDFGDSSRFGDNLPDQIAKGIERPLSDPARPLAEPSRPLFEPSRLAEIVERGKIKSLPGTQEEADTIHKLYPEANIVTGVRVQEAALIKELPKYRYLHFATHGLFSDVSPLQSAIVLAAPPAGSEEDGFLTAREIMELNLNAEMVVLSACETARGVNKQGEGVVGLTWALFAAGCPTQVVSQWKVSDASTPKLMEKFYGNLNSGQGKGKALQNAAIAMMKDGKHNHPYHWASFVLFGDWR